jgi:hypothetical protein
MSAASPSITVCASVLERVMETLKEVVTSYVLAKSGLPQSSAEHVTLATMISELAVGQSMIGAKPRDKTADQEIRRAADEFMGTLNLSPELLADRECNRSGLSLFKINMCKFVYYFTSCTSKDDILRMLTSCSVIKMSSKNFSKVVPTPGWNKIAEVVRTNMGPRREGIMRFIAYKRIAITNDKINSLREDALVQCDLLMSVFASVTARETKHDRLETSAKLIEAMRDRGSALEQDGKRAEFNYISTFFKKDPLASSRAAAGRA